jgi:hypothetical protein
MRRQPFAIRQSYRLLALFFMATAYFVQARESDYIAQGYWAWRENPGASEDRYVRITGDSGFYCFLDDKSSFAFAIAGDSITTPMNGKNAIAWAPGSGDIIITGEEKGEPYSDRFQPFDSTTYWAKCGDQEGNANVTGLGAGFERQSGRQPARREFKPGAPIAWQNKRYSLSGRKL